MTIDAPSDRYIYREHTTGEKVVGLAWLSVGALLSVLLEVVYVGARITVPTGQTVAFPFTILIAFGFTLVLSRTALLWTENRLVAGIPLGVWLLGYLALLIWPEVTGDIIVAQTLRGALLLVAGTAGGGWPLIRGK
ncbi:hypothetical protein JIM95_008400 [Corynebacterium sp. CCM 8835]|uniref:Uncharacterized protein n=1 Tax=Corynebacterium antarcticum TaxID=2800405 RepID=A0A9Q4GN56_9CORY|nr:hypothetical protein [Corynebacterium antarcticum]MCK7642917.1 hypothetical protein [Corynebacterium antarcticum]MCK7661420.1 hypothetical protein [Corynebacterium antarcticum]MCL0246157.1 hypothetical protein [Corynebacterium antarcticum]MCX7492406.1 hypothetical protein [Corynebacterium antarcticum]MCX7538481.1 hypothetical protein [Corynebacterium antarcticum]